MSADALVARLLEDAAAGAPPAITLMHLLTQAPTRAAADDALAAAHAIAPAAMQGRLGAVARLAAAHPHAHDTLAPLAAEASAAFGAVRPGETATWAALFDAAARRAPEAAVALYSLGDPAMLAPATGEIVDRLDEWRLLGADRVALDLGCGTGRLAAALAPAVARVVGLDVSGEMVARARARCPAATFRVGDGRSLAPFADGAFDLVLAVDAFPYIVASGLAPAMIGEIARVLRAGGDAVIFNYAYQDDTATQAREVAGLAAAAGLAVVRAGTRDLATWDGVTFHLRRERA